MNSLPFYPLKPFYGHVKPGDDGQAMGWGCWKCTSRLPLFLPQGHQIMGTNIASVSG